MIEETLFLKDKIINGENLELIFYKDYVWVYNEQPFPVISYLLRNCHDLSTVNFENIDRHNDGVMIDIRQENNLSVFETTDMGDIKVKIICEKVIIEEREYNKEDYRELIKEILTERDNEHEVATKYNKKLIDLKHFLNREIDNAKRKINNANWLPESKKHSLKGELEVLEKILDSLNN